MKRIVIGVGLAGYPISAAGNAWAFLQWALGFRKLGWDVWLVESIHSKDCIDANKAKVTPDQSVNVAFWKEITERFGFAEQASLFIDGETPNRAALKSFASETPVFLNISGHFKQADIIASIPHRIYLDLDPAFTQIWATAYKSDMNFAGHNHFFSVGARMDKPDVRIPSTGHSWKPTLPPVDIDYWKPGTYSTPKLVDAKAHWTTVTHWYGYPDIEWDGTPYGGKAAQFDSIIDLPSRTTTKLMIATDITPVNEEYQRFDKAGWKLVYGPDICRELDEYGAFLESGLGEFCVSKGGYVTSHCGWFSDRSACYLALGKPVILQETGWSEILGTGDGLIAFDNLESAQQALDTATSDYTRHSTSARKIAEKYLDARKVAATLIQNISLTP